MNLIQVLSEVYPTLLQGLGMTVQITVLSLLIAMVLGIFVCLMNISHNVVLRGIAKFYIWLIRGTPMLVQAFYFYFAMPQLIQSVTGFPVQNHGIYGQSGDADAQCGRVYFRDLPWLYRVCQQRTDGGGEKPWFELCQVHAEDHSAQAVRICLPSLVNQFIITLKDSTILYAIGLSEIMYNAKIYVGRTMESFATYTWVAVFFLLIVTVLSFISRAVERRMNA